jgi:hypothetical protein
MIIFVIWGKFSKSPYMKPIDFSKELDLYKEMVITKVDYHFNEYVLTDILDCGQIEYLIDEQSWFLYWLDVAEQLNSTLDLMISEYQDGKKGLRPMLNEYVSLKTIVDKKILDNSEFNKAEVFEYLGFELEKDQLNRNFSVVGSEDKKQKIIKRMHEKLSEYGKIDETLSDFRSHFIRSSSPNKKIKWLGTEIELVAFFNRLISKGIVSKAHQYNYLKTITIHFINKNDNAFKERQLGVSKSKIINEVLYADIIDIINDLSINNN